MKWDKFLLTCSDGSFGAQVPGPDRAAGSFGEFVGRHPVHDPADAAEAFVPPALLDELGFATLE